jgi:hypothetical protein
MRYKYRLYELIIAIIVMILVTYVFITRANLTLSNKVKKLGDDVVVVNENINTVNNNMLSIAVSVDSINIKQDYNVQKSFEMSDSIQTTIQLLKRTNTLLKQQTDLLNSMNRKQNIILDSVRKIR